MFEITAKFCFEKKAICIIGEDTGEYTLTYSKMFEEVLLFEPNTTRLQKLQYDLRDVRNLITSDKVVSNENKKVLFKEKGYFDTSSLTIDSLGKNISCIFVNVPYTQKLILLGAIDTINQFKPLLIVKKSSNNDYLELCQNIFSYRVVYEDNRHHYLVHWFKL